MTGKKQKPWLILIFIFWFISLAQADFLPVKRNTDFLADPPGENPLVFAEGLISDSGRRIHGFPTFSPDYSAVYWPVIPPQVLYMEKKNGIWSEPGKAPFSGGTVQAPVFSPDGKRIYFQSSRSGGRGSLDIWYVERDDDGSWSEPRLPAGKLNSFGLESQPSLTRNGSIYFTGSLQGSGWNRGIYRAEFSAGRYEKPELLPETVNSKAIDMYPFIDPSERFLLFSSSRPTLNEKDLKLFVTCRTAEGGWSDPVNVSDKLGISSPVRFGCLSPCGKYLFYMTEGRIYWVSSTVLKGKDSHEMSGNPPLLTKPDQLPPHDSRYDLKIARSVKLNENTVVLSGNPYETNQVILCSQPGLVLIDSGISPQYGELLKKKAAEIFPKKSIKYLINTHHHWDHSQGNQVFSDAVIIGHTRTAKRMREQARKRATAAGTPRPARKPGVPPPPPRPTLSDGEGGFICTPPRQHVKKQSTLSFGDITVHLIGCSGAHSDNDLIMWIPERGVAVTGDIFFKNNLPILSSKKNYPVADILHILDMLLAPGGNVTTVIPGHGELMTRQDLLLYRDYIRTLWTGITEKVEKGAGENEVLAEFSLKRKFPDLSSRDVLSQSGNSLHEGNLRAVYGWIQERQTRKER